MIDRRAVLLGILGLPLSVRAADLPPLHAAAAAGRTDELTHFLAGNQALVHSYDTEGNQPLHHAAWNNQLEAARILIQAGADVNARRGGVSNALGVTALESASFFGHLEMVRLLVKSRADVNVRVYDGNRPLHQAANRGHVAVCQYLIDHGAQLEAERDDKKTPLHAAATGGQVETALYLLAVGANPAKRGTDGQTPSGVATNEAVRQVLLRALVARADAEARLVARGLNAPSSNTARKVEIVYESRFASGTVGLEWTTSALGGQWNDLLINATPKNDRQFLGPFGSQEVRLALGKLPPHNALRIAFDLLVIGSWDGNGTPGDGPDLFELDLLGGPSLLSATFFNPTPALARAAIQSFPDDFPLGNHLGGTGALQRNVLELWKDTDTGAPRDSVYRLGFTVAHSAESVVYRFRARGLEALDNESWALSGVRVAALTLGTAEKRH